MSETGSNDRPAYDRGPRQMLAVRAMRVQGFARQILDTAAPFLSQPISELRVLDVGCGYGHTSVELARHCGRVVGIEPSQALYRHARQLLSDSRLANLEFVHQDIYDLPEREAYDLVVLDNVFEHLPDQRRTVDIISAAIRPGGALYLLTPNKLWPVEAHYGLPFLGYLPVSLANRYLQITRKGTDYTDASYAPTYWSLNRIIRARTELSFQYVLPAHVELATAGGSLHYRLGVALIRRIPSLWAISKALLVVATKGERGNA